MLIRISYLLLIVAIAIAAYLLVRLSRDSEGPAAAFVGVERCATCHTSIAAGRQYPIWSASAHASAWKALQSDSARRLIARPAGSIDSCIGCHTSLGRRAVVRGEDTLVSEGVGCERCHGPGSRYALYNVMTDRAAFTANGGVAGSLQDCYGCHAAAPGPAVRHCPFQTKPFMADSAWQSIRHPVNRKGRDQDTVKDLRPR